MIGGEHVLLGVLERGGGGLRCPCRFLCGILRSSGLYFVACRDCGIPVHRSESLAGFALVACFYFRSVRGSDFEPVSSD
jgi:hypothetical protein